MGYHDSQTIEHECKMTEYTSSTHFCLKKKYVTGFAKSARPVLAQAYYLCYTHD